MVCVAGGEEPQGFFEREVGKRGKTAMFFGKVDPHAQLWTRRPIQMVGVQSARPSLSRALLGGRARLRVQKTTVSLSRHPCDETVCVLLARAPPRAATREQTALTVYFLPVRLSSTVSVPLPPPGAGRTSSSAPRVGCACRINRDALPGGAPLSCFDSTSRRCEAAGGDIFAGVCAVNVVCAMPKRGCVCVLLCAEPQTFDRL